MVQCLRGLLIGWEGAPPRFVVMDADDSIGAAVEQVFPDAKIIVCWWHMANKACWAKARSTASFKALTTGPGYWLVKRNIPADAPKMQALVLKMKQYTVRPGSITDKGMCTCPSYMDNLVCKHLLGLRLSKGIEVNMTSLEGRRRPPKKRKRALDMQDSSSSGTE